MLLLLWWGVLLDCAAFNSTLPGVLQNHKSLLFGHTFAEVVEDVQGTYAAAWPSVLIAVASSLPGPKQLVTARDAGGAAGGGRSLTPEGVSGSVSGAGTQQQDSRQAAWSSFVDLVSSGADLSAQSGTAAKAAADGSSAAAAADRAAELWHQQLQLQCANMHAVLLEVCLMLLSDAAAACAAVLAVGAGSNGTMQELQQQQLIPAATAAARRVAVGLQALQLLLTQQHMQAGLVAPAVCCDVVKALTAVAEQVLLPWLQLVLLAQQQQQSAGDHPPAGLGVATPSQLVRLPLAAAAALLVLAVRSSRLGCLLQGTRCLVLCCWLPVSCCMQWQPHAANMQRAFTRRLLPQQEMQQLTSVVKS
jgi:hypothetical protein